MEAEATDGSVRYRVLHETIYEYTSAIGSSRQIAHLAPRGTPWQKVLSHQLEVTPTPAEKADGVDYFGNPYAWLVVDEPHDELIVRADSEVLVVPHAPALNSESPPWESALAEPGVWTGLNLDVEQYRVASPAVPLLPATRDYAATSFTPERPWLAAMLEFTQRIRGEFEYDTKVTTVSTSVAEVLQLKRGVCQDFAHLMLSALRSLGLPARYVSGYVLNRRKDGKDSNAGADASHAWVASFCPAHGWVAFDPTNGKIADIEFVTLGWGREYHDVSPLRGVVRGSAAQKLAVAVSVVPVADAANV
jgi:transglutaminase-like putative cysteine protease